MTRDEAIGQLRELAAAFGDDPRHLRMIAETAMELAAAADDPVAVLRLRLLRRRAAVRAEFPPAADLSAVTART